MAIVRHIVLKLVIENRVFELFGVTKVNLRKKSSKIRRCLICFTYQSDLFVLVDEKILWLEVTMHDLEVKALLESLDDTSCIEVGHFG